MLSRLVVDRFPDLRVTCVSDHVGHAYNAPFWSLEISGPAADVLAAEKFCEDARQGACELVGFA